MATTINYTDRNGKKRTLTFNSDNAIIKHLSDEVQRMEIRRMVTSDKAEIRKLLKAEKSFLSMLEFYSKRFGANGDERATYSCECETPEMPNKKELY